MYAMNLRSCQKLKENPSQKCSLKNIKKISPSELQRQGIKAWCTYWMIIHGLYEKSKRSLFVKLLMRILPIFGFSVAAATLSLSFICLFISCSLTCDSGVTYTLIFIFLGKNLSSLTFNISPIIWAIEQ